MKCFLSPLLLSAILLSVCTAASRADEPSGKGKIRVLLTYGGHSFEEEPFFAMFDAMKGIEYRKAEMPKDAGLLKPGLQKKFDVIVRYDMVPAVTPQQRAELVALLKLGIGVVSLHHNMGAHRDWDEYRKIIGGKFILKPGVIDGRKMDKSGWSHGEDLKVTVADSHHPITKRIKDFKIHDETYKDYYTAPGVKVLLKTDHPKNDPELAWTTSYGKSRVFYLMLGHDGHAYRNPNYQKLVAQGIHWAAGR